MHPQYIIYNGRLQADLSSKICLNIKGLLQGNVVFQEGMIRNNRFLFWDENYFNLMAAMRKMRMKIPMEFTIDFFQSLIQPYISESIDYSYRIYIFVEEESISHYIEIQEKDFTIDNSNNDLKIDVYKEMKIYADLLSSVKNPKGINIVAQKFAEENDLDDVFIMNTDLKIARTLQGNVYYYFENTLYGNTMEMGAYRQGIDQIFEKKQNIIRHSFSAFELQKAEEVFILSEGQGIIPIRRFRKKQFEIKQSVQLQQELIQ